MKKSFNIQELLHVKSKHQWNQAHAPLLSRAFQRHQEHNLKHPGSMNLITTKQNKLPCFIERWWNFILCKTLSRYTREIRGGLYSLHLYQ